MTSTSSPPWKVDRNGLPTRRTLFPAGVTAERAAMKSQAMRDLNFVNTGAAPEQCLAAALLQDALADAQAGDTEARAFLMSDGCAPWLAAVTPAGRDTGSVRAQFIDALPVELERAA